MKKWLITLSLLAVFALSAPAYSQDAPAAEQPAATAPAEPAALAPLPGAAPGLELAPMAEKAPEETGSPVMDSIKSVIVLLLGIIGTGLSLLLTGLIVKLLKKAGIDVSVATEISIRKIVDSGIRRTEVWAAEEKKQTGKKPESTTKLQKGVEKIDAMLTAFGLKKLAAKKIEELIEERLLAKKEKGEVVSDPTTM